MVQAKTKGDHMKKLLLTTLILMQTTSFAQTLTGKNGLVTFEAIGKPSMIKIKGEGNGAISKFVVREGKVAGIAQFELRTLKTGIELRDDHMLNKYLNAATHPKAQLKLLSANLPQNWSTRAPAATEQKFSGLLTLHGVEKPVQGQFNIDSNTLKLSAEFEIKLSDFEIEVPSYLGVKVADHVKIKTAFENLQILPSNESKK
jgi:CRISPR/Cas system-associated protein endoribonuclease Cas2